jgi:hypothetical protein
VSLTGWQFCTQDANETLRYSNGITGVTLAAGASLTIHYLNDSGGAPGTINRTTIGGSFALPLGTGAYSLALYDGGSFGTGTNIVTFVQWSIGGVDNTTADERSDEAQSGGVWTNQSHWVPTQANSVRFLLTAPNGATVRHGPADYTVVAPDLTIRMSGLVKEGATVTADVAAGVNIDVYRSVDLQGFGAAPVRTNVAAGEEVLIDDGAPEHFAYYLLVPTGSPAP